MNIRGYIEINMHTCYQILKWEKMKEREREKKISCGDKIPLNCLDSSGLYSS